MVLPPQIGTPWWIVLVGCLLWLVLEEKCLDDVYSPTLQQCWFQILVGSVMWLVQPQKSYQAKDWLPLQTKKWKFSVNFPRVSLVLLHQTMTKWPSLWVG